MNPILRFAIYLLVMAGVTYLIRVLPLLFFKGEVKSVFLRSFLFYVPYAVLSAMTFPAILTSAGHLASGIASAVVCLVLAYFGRSLLTVAAGGAVAALITESIIVYLIPLM